MTFVPPFLVFLAGVPLVLALPGRARRAALVAVAGAGTLTVFLLPPGETWTAPFMGYTLVLLRADPLSLFTGYIFGIITLLASLYAAAFARPWLHAYALLYAGTSLGAVFAGDFLTLLLFWEGMAVTSTLLIWEHGGAAVGAGFRYLLFHVVGGALLAAGIAMQSLEAGTLDELKKINQSVKELRPPLVAIRDTAHTDATRLPGILRDIIERLLR